MLSFRWQLSACVIPPIPLKLPYLNKGHQQVGSLAGEAPSRKDIERTQRQAHPAWKSGVECKSKSLSDCILNSTECRGESRV